MVTGQKGMYRMWGTTGTGMRVTAQRHVDQGYMCIQQDNGKYTTFSPVDGLVVGDADVPSAWERVTFDGGNIMVVQPHEGIVLPYEWFNL